MNARIICFASAKGGSGKTVITASIGGFLAAIGKKVLLIDTDAATNGLTLLYLKEVMRQADQARSEKRDPVGLYEGVSGDHLEVVSVPGGADLLPATYHFMNTEDRPLEEYFRSLQEALSVARGSYDVVLLDAQAGSDLYAQRAMSKGVSDTVVIVAEYDPLSAAGVERLKGLMSQDLTYERTWILLNKVLPEFAKNFSDFLEVVRYLSPIPWDSEVVRAYARRRLAIDVENGNAFNLAIMQVVRVLFSELEKDIDSWASSRASAIRQPIDEQYQDLEKEFRSLLVQWQMFTDRIARLNLRRQLFSVGVFGITGSGIAFLVTQYPMYKPLFSDYILYAVIGLCPCPGFHI